MTVIASGEIDLKLSPKSQANLENVLARSANQAGAKSADGFSRSFEPGMRSSVKRIGATLATGLVVKGAFDWVKGGIDALANLDRISGQTAAAIRSTGGAANVTADHVEQLAQSLEKTTTVEQEAIQEGANLLLTFKNVRNEAGRGNDIFDQSVTVLNDMAVAMGGDASSSAIQLGKALNDPIAGISALTRVGVTFTDQQKAQIKALVESGRVMEAQKIILAELNSEFGGSAEALGETLQGRLNQFNNRMGDLQESVAGAALPALEGFVTVAGGLAETLAGLPPEVVQLAGGFAALGVSLFAVVKLKGAIDGVTASLAAMGTAGRLAAGGIGLLSKLSLYAGGAVALGLGIEKLIGALGNIGRNSRDIDATAAALTDLTTGASGLGAVLSAGQVKGGIDGLLEKLEEMRSGFNEAERALATTSLKRSLGDIDDALGSLVKSGAADSAAQAFAAINRELNLTPAEKAKLFDDYAKALDGAGNSAKVQAAAQRDANAAAEEGTDPLAALGDAAGDTESEFDRLEAAVSAFSDKLNEALGVELAAEEAQSRFQAAIDKLTESLAANGNTFDLNTEAGRENAAARRDVIETAGREVEALARSAAITGTDTAQKQALIDRLNGLKATFPGLTTTIDGYIAKVNEIPDSAVTKVEVEGIDLANAKVQALNDRLDNFQSKGGRIKQGKAFQHGGYQPGPENQAFAATLHGGEYVLSADVVRAIKSGGPSRGAQVTPTFSAPPVATVAASTGPPVSLTLNVTVNAPNYVGTATEFAGALRAALEQPIVLSHVVDLVRRREGLTRK